MRLICLWFFISRMNLVNGAKFLSILFSLALFASALATAVLWMVIVYLTPMYASP